MTTSHGMTAEEARGWFSYNKATGVLTWRRRPSRCVKAGTRAGYVRPDGARSVRFKGQTFFEHRIIWLLVTGLWPQDGTDHINRDNGDNRWGNLRAADQHENAGNMRLHRHNTSGVRGVSFKKKAGLWIATIRKRGKHTHLGSFKTKGAAAETYRREARKHFGEFFNG